MCFISSPEDSDVQPDLRTSELGLFYVSMKGLSWGDKLFLAELGPEHMFLMDYILYSRSLEYFVLFRPKNFSKTQDGLGNPSCVGAGRHVSSLFGEARFGSAAPSAVQNPQRTLAARFGEGNTEGSEYRWM